MKMLPYLVAAVAIALPAAYLATRSTTAIAARPAAEAATQAVALAAADQRPLDADYMVPGVLDNRSWKPEYDRMPTAKAAPAVRLTTVAARRPAEQVRPVVDTIALAPAGDAPTVAAETVAPDVAQN